MVHTLTVTRSAVSSFILLAIIYGCNAQLITPGPEHPQEPDIDLVLAAAELNYINNQLTTPQDDNALQKYRAILVYNPENTRAIEGLNRIAEKYLIWARNHVDQGNLTQALVYVTLAESVDASHPNIGPVVKLINEREDQKTTTYRLRHQDVMNRRTDQIRFDTIARQIEQSRAFVTIRAPKDASGRWIYQELNARVSFRVEAVFKVSSTPSVVLRW